ncbi:MAG: GxxExxY protein [Gemmatimonadetes bacterium]|nr:GxxExxY protein [Gemmatimonadota bacterium]
MVGHRFEHEQLSSHILGAAVDVHKALGAGYLESVYGNALSVALTERNVTHLMEHEVDLYFHDVHVGKHRLDLLVDDTIVVELKAVEKIEEIHLAQLRSYLKSTKKRIGLLLNFNAPVLSVKRVVHTPQESGSAELRAPALPR